MATASLTSPWASSAGAIAGGSPGSVPGLARLDADGSRVCSASLVRPNWALTAAHCLGVDSLSIVSATGTRTVVETVVHPDFDPATPTTSADLALLRLATATNDPLASIVAADSVVAVDDVITLAGWGLLGDGSAPSTSHVGSAIVTSVDEAGMFATGGGATGCSGDSGGPAIRGGQLVGVLSASVSADCASSNLWVDVASQRPWIDSVLGRDGAVPALAGGTLVTPVDTAVEFPVEVADERQLTVGADITFVASGGSVTGCDPETEPTTCRFTPTAGFQGVATILVVAFDGTSIGTATWFVQVGEPTVNRPPVFTKVGPLSSPDGEPVSFVVDVSDPDGTVLTMDDVTVSTTAGTVECTDVLPATCTFTPSPIFVGTARVFAVASDGIESSALIVRVDVRVDLTPPVVASGRITVDAGETFEVTFTAEDERLGILGFDDLVEISLGVFEDSDFVCDLDAAPIVCTFPTAPGRSFVETISVTFTDGTNESTGTWIIEVVSTNRPPVIASPTPGQVITVVEGFPFEIPLSFSDPDGDPIDEILAQLIVPAEQLGCEQNGGEVLCSFHAPLDGPQVLDGAAVVRDPFGEVAEVPFTVDVVAWSGPRLSVDDVDVSEPARGRQRVTLVLELASPAVRSVSVAVQPDFDGSTVSTDDVFAEAATLTFRRGATRATYTMTVRADSAVEDTEFLALDLASTEIALGRPSVNVVITPSGG